MRKKLHEMEGHSYSRCVQCNLVSLDSMPSLGEAARIYSLEYFSGGTRAGGYLDYAADEEIHRLNARDRLQLISKHSGKEAGHMLDFGCGLGFFMDEARAAGWTIAGIDLSTYAQDYVQERFGLRVAGSMDEVQVPPGGFDVVCLFQVIEHTLRPNRVLEDLVSIAKPRSTFVIETWDRNSWIARVAGGRWHQIAPPAVTHLFDRGTLSTMLRNCELEASWVGRTSKRVSIKHVLHTACLKLPRSLAPVIAVVSRWIGEDRTVRYSLGDLFTIVARPASCDQ